MFNVINNFLLHKWIKKTPLKLINFDYSLLYGKELLNLVVWLINVKYQISGIILKISNKIKPLKTKTSNMNWMSNNKNNNILLMSKILLISFEYTYLMLILIE